MRAPHRVDPRVGRAWRAAPSATGYRLAAGGLVAAYAVCAAPAAGAAWLEPMLPATRFGFSQIQRFGWPGLAALAAGVWLASGLALRPGAARLLDRVEALAARPAGRAALSAVAGLIFWAARTRAMNRDGAAFQAFFERETPVHGVATTHDEILEFALHSAVWRAAHARLGWDVATTYQVLSVAAGVVFVRILLSYARLVMPSRPATFAGLALAGGYVQLFFGDVENYTVTAVAILGYFLAAERFLERRASVVWPSVCLAIAMMCHLLAGFLLPSLLYLWRLAARRQTRRGLRTAMLAFAGIIVATFAVAHVAWGLPIGRFLESHAGGHGGQYAVVLATPSVAHYWTQFNLLALLAPTAVFLVPAAAGGRLFAGERHAHLALASAGMLLFVAVWDPMLGPLGDWNLFANAAIPITLLALSAALASPGLVERRTALTATGAAAALHTAAWVYGNYRVSG